MEGGTGEFQDWELLSNSEMNPDHSPKTLDNSNNSLDFEGDTEGVIKTDYFSLDSEKRYPAVRVSDSDDDYCSDKSSNNHSWVDPGSDDAMNKVGFQGFTFQHKNSDEFWSDSASDDGSVSRKTSELEQEHELGFVEDDDKREVGFEGISETNGIEVDSGSDNVFKIETDLGFSPESSIVAEGGLEGGSELNSTEFVKGGEGNEIPEEEIGNMSGELVNSIEGEKRGGIVWWKLPFELLKFCAFRVSPVWSISVAAAVVGFVILRRRLHKMKRKSKSFPLNITVEDKNVSQTLARVARLNEAFWVVKRVPMIRPSLPASGMAQWPVMNLR